MKQCYINIGATLNSEAVNSATINIANSQKLQHQILKH